MTACAARPAEACRALAPGVVYKHERVLWPSVITAIAALSGAFGTYMLTERSTRARHRQDRAGAERALHRSAVVSALVVGHTFLNALQQVASAMKDPLANHGAVVNDFNPKIADFNGAILSASILGLPSDVHTALDDVRTTGASPRVLAAGKEHGAEGMFSSWAEDLRKSLSKLEAAITNAYATDVGGAPTPALRRTAPALRRLRSSLPRARWFNGS